MNIRWKEILSRAMESEWAVAYRRKENGEILNPGRKSFSLMKNTFRYWCADPFPAEEGDKAYVFFEAYDRLKRKGVIGYREFQGDGIGRIRIAIEEPFHLSYPYIYKEGGTWYLIPESKDSNQIIRYRSSAFPRKWIKDKVLVDSISAVDTTLLCDHVTAADVAPQYSFMAADTTPICDRTPAREPVHRVELKLITYLWECFNSGELQILRITDHSRSIICRISDPTGRKRPAGKIFRIGEHAYRPSQLCTKAYGEAVIFNRITESSGSNYAEDECRLLTVSEINLDRVVKISGVHTYNQSENWETIDVEIRGCSLIRIFGNIPRVYYLIRRKQRIRRKTEKG